MSRSGYTDDYGDDNPWDLIRWRGAVASAIRGKRGQAFLRELLAALDAMPEKRLIAEDLVTAEGCCALGAVAVARGMDVSKVVPDSPSSVSRAFGIAGALAQELAYLNDEAVYYTETPEQRWVRMRGEVKALIRAAALEEMK